MAAARRRARAQALLEKPLVLSLVVDIDDQTACPALQVEEVSSLSPICCTCENPPLKSVQLFFEPARDELRPGKHRLRVICREAGKFRDFMKRYVEHAEFDASIRPNCNQLGDLVMCFEGTCSDHRSDYMEDQPDPSSVPSGFREFRSKKRKPSSVNKDLIKKIKAPLALEEAAEPSEHAGFLYVMRHPSNPDHLKIGVSKHPPVRAVSLSRCYPGASMLAYTTLIPHAHRVESLVHAELALLRRKETCGYCETEHGEWFEITLDLALEAVGRWAKWILTCPYDESDGNLRDSWIRHTEHIAGLIPGVCQAQNENSWQRWINSYVGLERQDIPGQDMRRELEITVF
jgi:hypothetical protein